MVFIWVCSSGIRTRVIESSSCCSERSNHWTIDTTHLMRWYLQHSSHDAYQRLSFLCYSSNITVFELLRIRQINAKFEYNEPITHLMNATNISKQWVVITNKYQTQAQTQVGVLLLNFNLRLRNGDYQNPEIVFVLRPEHNTQESWDWSVLVPCYGIILKITYS